MATGNQMIRGLAIVFVVTVFLFMAWICIVLDGIPSQPISQQVDHSSETVWWKLTHRFEIKLELFLIALTYSLYFITSRSSPGFVPRANNGVANQQFKDPLVPIRMIAFQEEENTSNDIEKEHEHYRKLTYCQHCQIPKPPRSHHCSKCNRCVLKMDHHCVWVGVCIGEENQRLFNTLLFSGFLSVAYPFSLAVTHFIKRGLMAPEERPPIDNFYLIFFLMWAGGSVGLTILLLLLWQTVLIINNMTTIEFIMRFKLQASNRLFVWPYDVGLIRNLLGTYFPNYSNYNYPINPKYVERTRVTEDGREYLSWDVSDIISQRNLRERFIIWFIDLVHAVIPMLFHSKKKQRTVASNLEPVPTPTQ